MARDNGATQQTDTANKDYQAMQTQTMGRANAATDKFNSQLGTLAGGGSIAANPFTDPAYLRNLNIAASTASSAANNQAKQQLKDTALKTGTNTASMGATVRDLAGQRTRANQSYLAGQATDDYSKYLDWEKFVLGSTLAPAGVDTSMFATATGGRNSALNDRTQIQDTNNQLGAQMWSSILGAVGPALSGGASLAKAV